MGIFGIKRREQRSWEEAEGTMRASMRADEPVRKLRRKKAIVSLKAKKKGEARQKKLEKIKGQTEIYKVRAERAEAKQRIRKAGRRLPALPSVKMKIKKRKQGRKLSRKGRIRLI